MSDIKKLQDKIIEFRDARDWGKYHTPKTCTIHMMRETIEVLDHFLHKDDEEIKEYAKKNKKEIGEELSDVLSWTLVMFHDLDIDVKKAYMEKMKQNEKKYPVEKAKGVRKKYTDL